MPKLEVAVALHTVVVCRIKRLMPLGRECPELDVSPISEPNVWKVAYILNEKALPKKVLTMNEVVKWIVSLGGFLGRKGDVEPGSRRFGREWNGWHHSLPGWSLSVKWKTASDLCVRTRIEAFIDSQLNDGEVR